MKTNALLLLTTAGFILAPPVLPFTGAQDSLRVDTAGNPVSTLNLGSAKLIGTLSPSRLGTGSPTPSTFLRGDGSWAGMTPGGNTIAATGSVLMGDSAGDAVAIPSGSDLFRVLKIRRETNAMTEVAPVNLLPLAYNLTFNNAAYAYNADGTLTVPANAKLAWWLPGFANTYAGQTLYCYAVALGVQPYGALLIEQESDPYNHYASTNSTLAPGTYRSTWPVTQGNGDLHIDIINTTGAPITIYAPVVATLDTGLALVQSNADYTPVAIQPVSDFDFSKFESADRTGRYRSEKQTTKAFDNTLGNDNAAGTLYAPFRSLSRQTFVSGDVAGLYRGNTFRDLLSVSTQAVTQGVVATDVGLGATGSLPIVSALDTVASGSWTSNGDGTYSALWTPVSAPLDTSDQGKPFVVEINTAAEAATPFAARRSLTLLSSQSAVASTVGSCFILPPGTGSGQSGSTTQYKAVIHPSGTFANYRYEVVSRSWATNWQAGNLGGGDGAMSGLSLFNGSHGYGAVGPARFVADRMIFSHASLHHAVFGSGSLQRSVFYEMGVDNTDNSSGNSAIQFVWYTNDGTGLSFDTRHCIFYAVNGHFPASFLAHTGGNNYARGDLSDCAFVGGRIADGSLRGAAIQYNNVASGTINRVFVQGYADALLLNVQPIEVKNCVFRQVHEVQVTSNFHDNLFAEESASIPGSYSNYPLALVMQANGASATNNIAWAHGLPTGVTFDLYSTGIVFASGVTTATIQRNVIILDPDASCTTGATYANFPSGASATAGFSMDYNLVISTAKGGVSTTGGSGNTGSWLAYQTAFAPLDAHSMFVDLSGDPRGLKAVFADPANGDFRWAQTEIARRCAAYCKTNNVGPATVTSRWPIVPAVDEAARLITGL